MLCFGLQLLAIAAYLVNSNPTNRHHSISNKSHDIIQTTCTDPDDNALWNRYLNHVTREGQIHESFYMAPRFENLITPLLRNSSTGNSDDIIEGRPEVCKSSSDANSPLRERSTCPYFLVLNVDNDR